MNHQPSEERLKDEWRKCVCFPHNGKTFHRTKEDEFYGRQIANWWLDKMKEDRNKVVEFCQRKSVDELKSKMGEAYNDLSVQFAYKEGYNKSIEDILNYIEGL